MELYHPRHKKKQTNPPVITSITAGPRQSNFELLRIVATMMIIGLHVNFWLLGIPDGAEFVSHPLTAWSRTIFEFLCIVSVNIFVMISGWFGIRPSVKGFCNFAFQFIFIFGVVYLGLVLLGKCQLTLSGILTIFCYSPRNWFIKAYIGLYILAPILNAYLKAATERRLATLLIAFYIFQTIYGFMLAEPWFNFGYSTFSFIGLYLLAHYLRNFGNHRHGFGIFIVTAAINILAVAAICYSGHGTRWIGKLMGYDNPMVVLGAAGLMLWASQLAMKPSIVINTIAKSSFAAYLFHASFFGVDYIFRPTINYIYSHAPHIPWIFSATGGVISFFLLGILIDQPRIWLWNRYILKRFKQLYFK